LTWVRRLLIWWLIDNITNINKQVKVILSLWPKIRIAMVPVSTGRLPSSRITAESSARLSLFVRASRHALHHAGLRCAGDSALRRISSCRQHNAGQSRLADRRNPVPGGVICLISAREFHEITTQIPNEAHVALPRGAEEPRLCQPPNKPLEVTMNLINLQISPIPKTRKTSLFNEIP